MPQPLPILGPKEVANTLKHVPRVTQAQATFTETPDRIANAVDMYARFGIQPGSFTCSLIENDLVGAVLQADPGVFATLKHVVLFRREYPALMMGSTLNRIRWQSSMSKFIEFVKLRASVVGDDLWEECAHCGQLGYEHHDGSCSKFKDLDA